MRLSPKVVDELNQKVMNVDMDLQNNKYHYPEYYQKNSQKKPEKSSLSKDIFDSKHLERFHMLGLSDNAKTELISIMELLWRTLYDPNAYQDPSFDKELSANLKTLFGDGPPKCCDDMMYVRASDQNGKV
jgi:hypothetical protein